MKRKKTAKNGKKKTMWATNTKKLPAIDPQEPKEKRDEVRQYVSHFYKKKKKNPAAFA